MDQSPCSNKEKLPFSNLQKDNSKGEKVPLTHTLKMNSRRSKARALRRAMKEKSTIEEPHETPVCIWRPKRYVMALNKKLNQDMNGYVCISYKKRRFHQKIYH